MQLGVGAVGARDSFGIQRRCIGTDLPEAQDPPGDVDHGGRDGAGCACRAVACRNERWFAAPETRGLEGMLEWRGLWLRVWPEMVRRYAKFCLVGASGMGVDMLLLHFLNSPAWLGWNLAWSKALAAEAALLNNFVWNEIWTFRGLAGAVPQGGGDGAGRALARWRARLWRLAKFNLICLAGIGWSVLLLYLQVYGLGWNVYLSNFIAIVLVSFWNFGLNLTVGWGLPTAAAPALGQAHAAGPGSRARTEAQEESGEKTR